MSTGHKCDKNLLFWACCLHSDNFYGPLFQFIKECAFDYTVILGTLSINYGMYQASVHIVSKPSKPTFLKIWLRNLCSCHCLLLRGLHNYKNARNMRNMRENSAWNIPYISHISPLCLLELCWLNLVQVGQYFGSNSQC